MKIKFTGFIKTNLNKNYYDILTPINQYSVLLSDHQQKYLPIQLKLVSVKETFKVEEPVEFEVILENVAKQQYLVKSFGVKTLYFLFNNQTWETRQLSSKDNMIKGGKNVVLKSGEAIRMQFRGDRFKTPREIEVYCRYQMAINGVQPYAKLKIKIEK